MEKIEKRINEEIRMAYRQLERLKPRYNDMQKREETLSKYGWWELGYTKAKIQEFENIVDILTELLCDNEVEEKKKNKEIVENTDENKREEENDKPAEKNYVGLLKYENGTIIPVIHLKGHYSLHFNITLEEFSYFRNTHCSENEFEKELIKRGMRMKKEENEYWIYKTDGKEIHIKEDGKVYINGKEYTSNLIKEENK